MIGAGRDTQGRHDRSGGRRDSRSEGRPEDGCGQQSSAGSTTPAKSVWKKPRSWWKTLSDLAAAGRRARPDPRSRRLVVRSALDGETSRDCSGLLAILAVRVPVLDAPLGNPAARLDLGLGLQFAFAFLVLKTDFGEVCSRRQPGRQRHARITRPRAASFVFGDQLGAQNAAVRRRLRVSGSADRHLHRSFFAILYYLGVMQMFVKRWPSSCRASWARAARNPPCVAASIFMGQTEAPLTIRPFLAGLTESELFTIMASGMAHVSGAVMAAYVKIAACRITHLLTAVIMTAPATSCSRRS